MFKLIIVLGVLEKSIYHIIMLVHMAIFNIKQISVMTIPLDLRFCQ